MLTLVFLFNVFTVGNGSFEPRYYWTNQTCESVYDLVLIEISNFGGGSFTLLCEEFDPIHEADLAL
jgi:hypothetical protein